MTFDEFKKKYGLNLNPEQEKACQVKDGNTLLLAVPGSGKTTVMVLRVGYLILCEEVKPEKILCITFSKASAVEMEARFHEIFGKQFQPKFCTIHSLCSSILFFAQKKYGIHVPALEPNADKIVREALQKLGPTPPTRFLVRTMQGCMTAAKNKLMTEKEMARLDDSMLRYCYKVDFPTFFHHYEEYKKQKDIMDFDDLLDLAADLLYNDSRVLNHFRSRYQYICIDEVQDTSRLQFEVIDAISDKANLFMVGDDDQSIYGFRGAEPQNILHFTDDYESGDVLHMDTNYRSQKDIITAAAHFISMNKIRYQKDFVGVKNERGFIIVTDKSDENDFYDTLLGRIKDAEQSGETLGVLAAVNVDLLPVVDKLQEHGIGVRRRDSFESFFYSPIICELLGFLFLSKEPANYSYFLDCYNGLEINIPSTTLQQIRASCKKNPKSPVLEIAKQHLSHSAMYIRKLEHIMDFLEIVSTEKPAEAIQSILDDFYSDRTTYMIGEGLWSEDYCSKMTGILKFLAKRHTALDTFLEQMVSYKTSSDDCRDIESSVMLSTIHGAKGLEFDHVIVIDAIDGIMPLDSEAATSEDEEENARLFYVAVTRAKEAVEFITPEVLFGQLQSRSQYIDILLESVKGCSYEEYLSLRSTQKPHKKKKTTMAPISKPSHKKRASRKKKEAPPAPPIPKYSFLVGMSARHVVFGRGTIIDINGDVVTLDFGANGIRKIMKAYLQPA